VDTLVVGESRQLTATAHYASGAEIPGSEFAWWSHDATIASITGKGVVTARAPGEVTVGATSASVGGAARIVVITRR
jgi:uncharacterized protein YjdB